MRFRISAIAALLALGGCIAGLDPSYDGPKARFAGSYEWLPSEHHLGGFSGLELSDDGARLHAVSDRGGLVTARITRKEGRIVAVEADPPQPLTRRDGQPISGFRADAEGLAILPDGRMLVSFEGFHRVWMYDGSGKAIPLKLEKWFRDMGGNSGFEGLAVDAQGRPLVIPEKSGQLTRAFPVWRLDGDAWRNPFDIPRSGGFLPVGLDFGPDGRLYLLERLFTGFGFASRVRRFTLENDRITAEETLMRSAVWQHDNLEGLAVWRDDTGAIRLTMISDDNFRSIQQTQIVEYVLNAK